MYEKIDLKAIYMEDTVFSKNLMKKNECFLYEIFFVKERKNG